MDLFRTKDISRTVAGTKNRGLAKTLGAVDLVLLGIGCIIGTGIFVLTGVAAARFAGPGITLSFILSGSACGFAALAYAELAAMVPVAGSAYTFAYVALGEIVAFLVGWALILEYTVGAAAVAAGWSGYFAGLAEAIGFRLPKAFTAVPSEGGIVNMPAVIIVLLLTALLIQGTRESASLNKILVTVKLSVVALFLVLAVPHVNPVNWEPFLPFGYKGIAAGAAIVFFAYIGFDAVATAAEECRRPNRDLPTGIIGSLIVCTVLYIVVAGVLTGIVPYGQLDNSEPVAFALHYIGINWGSAVVAVGAICGMTTVLLVFIFGQSRVFLAMARDGMLPAVLAKLHPRHKTPFIITVITGIAVAAISAILPISIIAELTNAGTLFAFIVASVGVLVLRYTRPTARRPFRCPAVTIIAPLAVVFCSYLLANLPLLTWKFFGSWLGIGLVVYFLFSRRHSVLAQNQDGSSGPKLIKAVPVGAAATDPAGVLRYSTTGMRGSGKKLSRRRLSGRRP
ncbi:amino acid permease [Anaeroselena agilis]|uniref:Amino acid permease n=1 Tax=Anaeroselena agilis TaxID=3063788 RepID=A0ABU3NWP2_9FIRM|nr:amino acid permease [Selenomonadales bacterium 4137-cl]